MILLKLFWEFLKIGLFSVGGGMATLPFLYDLADSTGWYTYSQLADMSASPRRAPWASTWPPTSAIRSAASPGP